MTRGGTGAPWRLFGWRCRWGPLHPSAARSGGRGTRLRRGLRTLGAASVPWRGLPLLAALVGCGTAEEPTPSIRALPPGAGAEACDAEPFDQLRTICLVEAAARAGREADAPAAEAACAQVPDGAWREECRFRSAEELALRGDAVAALRGCAEAGRFARFCVTHVGWKLPPPDDASAAIAFPDAPNTWVDATAPIADAELRAEAAQIVRARWHFARLYGTGRADPAAVRAAAPEDAADARGAFALEAVRLLNGDLEAARAAFDADAPLTGPALALDRRFGRYDGDLRVDAEAALPFARTFGGGRRLVAEDPSEDRDVALLEALAFREPAAPAEAFAPHLDDPRRAVRLTAVRHFRTRPSPDAEAVLTRLAADPDPAVAAHAADGLRYRTWLGKSTGPGRVKRATAPKDGAPSGPPAPAAAPSSGL